MQGQNDLKKEEQDLKAAAQDLHAFNNSTSYNRFLYTCLTLACNSTNTSSSSTNSSGNCDKNQSGTERQDKSIEVGSAVGKSHCSTLDANKVQNAIGVSAESLGVTPAPTSSPIFSSPFPERISEIFDEENLLSKVIQSIPNMISKKASCRLGVLSSHFNQSVYNMRASTNGVLSSDPVIGQDSGNVMINIDKNGTSKTKSNRFRWYSKPSASSPNDVVGDHQENSTEGFFTMLARQGNRTADTQADMCSMTG